MPALGLRSTLGESVRTVSDAELGPKGFQEDTMNMKKLLELGGLVAGVVLLAFGVVAIAMGINGGHTVNNNLKQQQIVGSADFSPAAYSAVVAKSGVKDIAIPSCNLASKPVTNGATARCFAQYMQGDALMATGGYYFSQMGIYTAKAGAPKSQLMVGGGTDNSAYAQLDPTTKQPVQNGARNVWVTETALGTALNTAYMADQLALFGIVVGVALLLSGIGFIVLTWAALHRSREASAEAVRQATAIQPTKPAVV